MDKYIYDENSGLWYELQGEYYLPCLTLPSEEKKPIGIWGQRHLRYLKEYHRVTYTNLLTNGSLNAYLADIDEQAKNMFFRLIEEYADRRDVTEQLKADKPLEWVQKMNNICNAVEEVVNTELIYA